jgi:hypothetical protein
VDLGPEAGGDTITIEIHRLASRYSDGGWDAAAEWSVTVRTAQGGTLTEFDANEEASSPNYTGRDNEKETLSEAFRKAVEKTAKGLRGVSAAENARPRQETHEGAPGAGFDSTNSRQANELAVGMIGWRVVERFSHSRDSGGLMTRARSALCVALSWPRWRRQ